MYSLRICNQLSIMTQLLFVLSCVYLVILLQMFVYIAANKRSLLGVFNKSCFKETQKRLIYVKFSNKF